MTHGKLNNHLTSVSKQCENVFSPTSSLASFPHPFTETLSGGWVQFFCARAQGQKVSDNTNLNLIKHAPLRISSDRSGFFYFCIRLQVNLEIGLTFFLIKFFEYRHSLQAAKIHRNAVMSFIPIITYLYHIQYREGLVLRGLSKLPYYREASEKPNLSADQFHWSNFGFIQSVKISRYLGSVLSGKRLALSWTS